MACGSDLYLYADDVQVDLLPPEAEGEGGSPATSAGGEGLETRRKRSLEWCLDHGFEYVEADCRHPERGERFHFTHAFFRRCLGCGVWPTVERRYFPAFLRFHHRHDRCLLLLVSKM